MAKEITTMTPSELSDLQRALGLEPTVMVRRADVNAAPSYFTALANTGSSRMAALAEAIAVVAEGDVIELINGEFTVADGEPLTSFTEETGWFVVCRDGASHVYENEVDAQDDCLVFPGSSRIAAHFGGIPNTGEDMQPRIQAALFSMPPATEVQEPIAAYPEMSCRRGRLFLQHGQYLISKSVYFTGFQQVIGDESRGSQITQMAGFAPSSHPDTEVFSFVHVRAVVDGGSFASNFTFECRIVNLAFDCADIVGNVKGSGLLMGGAQGSELDNVTIFGIPKRGIVYHEYTTYFKINRLWLHGAGADPTGPLLEIPNCQGFSIGLLSVEGINNQTAASGLRKQYLHDATSPNPETSNLMGVCIYGCRNFSMDVINGEELSTLLRLKGCHNFRIGPCSVQEANGIDRGEAMVSIFDCGNYSIGPFHGAFFERLYEIFSDDGALQSRSKTLQVDIDDDGDPETPDAPHNAPFARTGAIQSWHSSAAHTEDDEVFLFSPVVDQIYLQRREPDPVSGGSTPNAKKWGIHVGGPLANNSFSITSMNAGYVATSEPILIQAPGGNLSQMPAGYTIALDWLGGSAVHVGKILNIGGNGAAGNGELRINNAKILGPQGAAIANATDAASAITQLNLLLAACRAHGLIAT